MSLTFIHENAGSEKVISPFILEPSQNKQIHTEKSYEFSELPPSHFSFNSEHSYVKKYQELTSSPRMFQQSLKDLRHVGEDEEHEYFKYEKNLKNQMYYAKGKNLKEENLR
jgi:hypothetical protein